MDDISFRKMQFNINDINHKLKEHDTMHLHAKNRMDSYENDINMLKMIHESQKEANAIILEIAGYAKETLEVVRPLMKAIRWVGFGAKWVATVGAASLIIWNAAKWGATKIGLLYP